MNIEPLRARLLAFGADAHEVDGHDLQALAALAQRPRDGKALVFIGRTDPCLDMDLLRRRAPKLHYVRLSREQERQECDQSHIKMSDVCKDQPL